MEEFSENSLGQKECMFTADKGAKCDQHPQRILRSLVGAENSQLSRCFNKSESPPSNEEGFQCDHDFYIL